MICWEVIGFKKNLLFWLTAIPNMSEESNGAPGVSGEIGALSGQGLNASEARICEY